METYRATVALSSGTVDITPQRLLSLGGYEKRPAPFRAIADHLEANVLMVRAGHSRVVIVSTDLLYPGEALRTSLAKTLGVNEEWAGLFLCASHTHFAPMTAASMPRLGVADAQYVNFVSAQIARLIRASERRETSTVCTYHEGSADHSMNRRFIGRRLTRAGLIRSARWGPNPTGARDETIRLLKFSKPNGDPVAIIWNYACHPNCFPERRQISAEYPGVVRARLRKEFGEIPILFLQGFCGDVRPPFLGTSGVKGLMRRVLLGPQFRIPLRREWEQWSNGLANSVKSVAWSSPMTLELHAPVAKRVEMAEEEFSVGGAGNRSLFWHLIDCGGFKIVGINAEPVVEYRWLIEKHFDRIPLLTVGCLDETQCYLPTDHMVPEGGYEVDGFRRLFSFDARFREQLQDRVLKRLRDALT
jgi:hypothetical protein